MIDKINVDRQGLTTQVETALKQNADLLKTLKETAPSHLRCSHSHTHLAHLG